MESFVLDVFAQEILVALPENIYKCNVPTSSKRLTAFFSRNPLESAQALYHTARHFNPSLPEAPQIIAKRRYPTHSIIVIEVNGTPALFLLSSTSTAPSDPNQYLFDLVDTAASHVNHEITNTNLYTEHFPQHIAAKNLTNVTTHLIMPMATSTEFKVGMRLEGTGLNPTSNNLSKQFTEQRFINKDKSTPHGYSCLSWLGDVSTTGNLKPNAVDIEIPKRMNTR